MLEGHPLRKLFADLTRETFYRELHHYDSEVAAYLVDLLVGFTHVENLYKILGAASFGREREVRKHVGDYTLFLTGLFPEHVKRSRRSLSLDYFVDYVKAGKESYRIVSKFDQFEYRRVAPLFRRLAENFEVCVYGLNRVRDRLRRMENSDYRRIERTLIT